MKLFVLLLLFACNEKYAPPAINICTISDGTLICADPRINKGKAYSKLLENNYICTSPDDYDRIYAYCADMRKERIKLEKRAK